MTLPVQALYGTGQIVIQPSLALDRTPVCRLVRILKYSDCISLTSLFRIRERRCELYTFLK